MAWMTINFVTEQNCKVNWAIDNAGQSLLHSSSKLAFALHLLLMHFCCLIDFDFQASVLITFRRTSVPNIDTSI